MPLWQGKLYIFMQRNGANPTDSSTFPRAVWMRTQVTL